MDEQKYWYRISIEPRSSADTTLVISFPKVPVVHEEENLIVLGTTLNFRGDVTETLELVKSLNRGPYYPTPKDAATAALVFRLDEIEDMEQDLQTRRSVCKELLKFCRR